MQPEKARETKKGWRRLQYSSGGGDEMGGEVWTALESGGETREADYKGWATTDWFYIYIVKNGVVLGIAWYPKRHPSPSIPGF